MLACLSTLHVDRDAIHVCQPEIFLSVDQAHSCCAQGLAGDVCTLVTITTASRRTSGVVKWHGGLKERDTATKAMPKMCARGLLRPKHGCVQAYSTANCSSERAIRGPLFVDAGSSSAAPHTMSHMLNNCMHTHIPSGARQDDPQHPCAALPAFGKAQLKTCPERDPDPSMLG